MYQSETYIFRNNGGYVAAQRKQNNNIELILAEDLDSLAYIIQDSNIKKVNVDFPPGMDTEGSEAKPMCREEVKVLSRLLDKYSNN